MASEDDLWVLHHVKDVSVTGMASYRYRGPGDVVHRAVWRDAKWLACCGEKVVDTLQEGDVGAVTCVRCLGAGA